MNLREHYIRSDEVAWEQRASYFVVGGGINSGLLVGNSSLVDLLKRFDGQSTVEQIIEGIAAEHRAEPSAVARPVLESVGELLNRGLITPEQHARGRSQTWAAPQSNASHFSHLFIEMTSKCNLRCKHCYMEGGLARPNELQLHQMVELIQEFVDIGGTALTLSGGESLMYRNWPVLAQYGAERGLGLSLMTNGTYLDQRAVQIIKKNKITVGLGLDGIKAETHDANRGKGSFKQTMDALELLKENAYQYNTTICFTPMKLNIYDLPGIVEMMRESGLPRLYVSLLEDRGRASYYRDHVELTNEQRRWLLEYLYQLARESVGSMIIEVTHHTDIFQRLLFDDNVDKDKGRHLTIRITSDGEVYLSAYMGAPELMVGRVGESSLRAMLESDLATEILRSCERRYERIPKCRQCVYKQVCRGGSAVLAYSKFGTFIEPDDYCDARISLFDRVTAEKAAALGLH